AAEASLDQLFSAVGAAGCCVLLADSDGVPVERRGEAGDDATFEDWGLWPGALWSEATEGTNGIGTCVIERRPVTVHRDQHFFARNGALGCMAA
ncbi:GAF domain-containing protein, partial [Rhodoplanes roseus]